MLKIANIENLKNYIKCEKTVNFIKEMSADTACGKYSFCDDCFVNVVEYDTKLVSDDVFEMHKKHIDIHILLSGEETILQGKDSLTPTELFDDINDGGLFKCKCIGSIDYIAKEMVVVPAMELHMAGYTKNQTQKIKKAIVKCMC